MIIAVSIVFLIAMVLSEAAMIFAFRFGASVYHAGYRQSPPELPIEIPKREEKDGKEKKPEETWDEEI